MTERALDCKKEELEKRDQIANATQAVREKRREIIRQIKRIQPEAGKNLKDVEVPQALFQLARDIVNDPEASLRFNKVEVYKLLEEDLKRRARDPAYAPGVTLDKAGPVLDGWKLASFSLFRYALNLILAPTRAEFKKMKLSTSFYVYNISRNLHHAEKVFLAMGYRQTDKKEKKESQDLVYDGDVKIVQVLETATDLLVMHEEVLHLKKQVSMLLRSGTSAILLQNVVERRILEFAPRSQWGSNTPRVDFTQSPHINPTPPQYHNPTPAHSCSQAVPVTMQTNPASNVVEGHEWAHLTHHDYANVSGGPGALTARDAPASNKPQGYVNLAIGEPGVSNPQKIPPQASTSHTLEGGYHHQDQQQITQLPPMNTTYGHLHPNQTPQHQLDTTAAMAQAGGYTAADQYRLYDNIPGLQQHPGPPQRQHSHLGHQQPVAPPPGGGWEGRRSSHPTTFPPPITTHTTGWDGPRAINPTSYQNCEKSVAIVSATNPPNATGFPTYSTAASSQFQGMSPAVSRASGPPSPATTTRPVPTPRKPRSNLPLTPTPQDDPEKLENQNVHRQMIERGQPSSQPSPGSQDSLIANLPPPITDFTTPLEDTPSFESGIKSGLMSGFSNPTGGGGYNSFSFPRDSGPPGFGDSQPLLPLEQTSASSSAMSQGTTASSESLDLYSSGTCLQQRGRQSSSQMSKQPPSQPLLEEEEEGERDEGGLQMAPTPTSPIPTFTTQGSMDNVPRELPTEPESSLRKKSYSKSHSVDMVEGDRPHQEKNQQPLRHIQSGSNLPAMEERSFQRDPVKKLEKPQPAPRRSRSPSPTGSGEPSPSASPKLAPCHRATHEPWTPTGQNHPFPPPPDASPKWQTLPRQAQSVEVEPQSNKVMPRFSSGSDLLRDKTASKHLEFKPPVARREFEPDTPVVGLLPPHLKKLQSQSAASTQPVKPQTPPGGSEPPPHQSHTHPQNFSSEHLEEKQQLKEQLQQEQQQRMELERRLKQLEQQQQQELQQLQQQQQEKEETQKRLRDLELQLEQQQQQKKESYSKPPFLSQQQKSVAVVSPTNAQATASLSKPDESQLEFGGEGAQALRAQKYSREAASQQYPGEGKLRERANADASRYRPKRTSTDKPTHKSPEQETSFTDPPTQDSGGVGTQKSPDMVTHIDLEDTWVCTYCTNLNSDSLPNCEVCERPDPRPRTWVCNYCQNHNPRSLSQCQACRRPQETTV